MITNNKQLVLESLHAIYTTKTRNYYRFNGPQYARAVYLRYFKGLTLQEIGDELGVSRERARQCIGRGMSLIEQRLKRKYRINDMSHTLDA
jgi:DNA-binding transcriptional regulator LsrR (DeoR family)